MADHGDCFPRAKRWMYDSGTLTPLIIKDPTKQITGYDSTLISFTDLAPTVHPPQQRFPCNHSTGYKYQLILLIFGKDLCYGRVKQPSNFGCHGDHSNRLSAHFVPKFGSIRHSASRCSGAQAVPDRASSLHI